MHRRTRGREESLPAFPLLQHPLRHARWDPSADGRVQGGTGLGTQADAIPRPALQVILWLLSSFHLIFSLSKGLLASSCNNQQSWWCRG